MQANSLICLRWWRRSFLRADWGPSWNRAARVRTVPGGSRYSSYTTDAPEWLCVSLDRRPAIFFQSPYWINHTWQSWFVWMRTCHSWFVWCRLILGDLILEPSYCYPRLELISSMTFFWVVNFWRPAVSTYGDRCVIVWVLAYGFWLAPIWLPYSCFCSFGCLRQLLRVA